MIEIELPLRCPFCGGKAEVHSLYGNDYFVKCSKCEINQDKLYKQRCDVVKAWNKGVAVVKHGKWLWELADNGWADHICSQCGYTINTDVHVIVDYDYCPNCGARMDGERWIK